MAKQAKKFNKTPVGRVYFAHVFEKRQYKSSTPKYELTLVWDDDRDLDPIRDEIDDVIAEKWPKKIPRGLHDPLRENYDDEYFPDGSWCIRFSSKYKPPIVDAEGLPISEDEGNEGEFYSGCYAQVLYDCFAYSNDGEGVSFELKGIRKLKDGEPLSGGRQLHHDEVSDAFDDDDDGGRGRRKSKRRRDDDDEERPRSRRRRDDDDEERPRSRRRRDDDDDDDEERPRSRRRRDDDDEERPRSRRRR